MRILGSIAAMLVFSLMSATASAQTPSLRGSVTDPQGGAVMNALVTLTVGAERPRATRSASDGTFSFDKVPTGDHVLQVDAPGFVRWRRNVPIAADGTTLAVTLQIAGVSENVDVVGAIPATLSLPTLTASRLGLTLLEIPASVQILPGELIRERGDISVAEAKSRAVGVTAQANPGNGGGGLAARGFTGVGSVMQLYDGGLLFVGSGTVSFPFDPWTVDRIEVLGGPASVMFGTGAIGGVVNVVPRKPNSRTSEHAMRLAAGSHNSWRAAVDMTGPVNDRLSYRLDVSHNRSDGWVERGDSNSTAVSASLRYDVTPRFNLTLSEDYGYQRPEKYFGVPLINGQLDKSLRRRNFNVSDADIYYKDNWTQLRAEWRPSADVTVRSNLHALSTNRFWHNGELYAYQSVSGLINRTSFIEIFHHQRQYGNRTEALLKARPFGRANTASVGFDYNWIRFQHVNNSPYGGSALVPLNDPAQGTFINLAGTFPRFRSHSQQISGFAEDRLELTSRFSVLGGFRVDRYEAERFDYVTRNTSSRTFTPTSWRGGAVYRVRPDLSLYAHYATATDFVGNLISQSPAVQAFDPTTGRQVEVGAKQTFWSGRAEWTVAGYEIVKEKLLVPDPNNPTVSIQVGQQSSRGFEASAALALSRGVRIEANGTVLRPRFDDFTENVGGIPTSRVGNTPPNVPRRAANLWLTWSVAPKWQVRSGLRYVGDRFANNANTFKIPSYTVIDAGVRRTLTERLTADLRIYNAFDRIYAQTIYGGAAQWLLGRPRAVEFALTAGF